jgi:hypothetical protein
MRPRTCGLTLPSRGRLAAAFASCKTPFMSNVKPHMQDMSSATAVNALLAELSSVLGFSMAVRDGESFMSLVEDIEGFTDRVFFVEGVDPCDDTKLREQVRARVARHLDGRLRREA